MIFRCIGIISLIKLLEFTLCGVVASVLFYLSPGVYQANLGYLASLQGGFRFAALFNGISGYPILSAGLLAILLVMMVRSKVVLSACAAAFFLTYSAYVAIRSAAPFPILFWIAWATMGCVIFGLHLLVLKKSGIVHVVPDSVA